MKTKYILLSLCLMTFIGCNINTPLEVTEKPADIVYGSFTDARDGITYKTIQIGNQTWMAENLRYMPEVYPYWYYYRGKECYYVYGYDGYDVKEARAHKVYNSNIGDYYSHQSVWQHFGTLYNNTAAQTAAPEGWRLPKPEDFKELFDYVQRKYASGDRYYAAVLLKQSSYGMWSNADNWKQSLYYGNSGFDAMPAGKVVSRHSYSSGNCYEGDSRELGVSTYYWLSDVGYISCLYCDFSNVLKKTVSSGYVSQGDCYSTTTWSNRDFYGYSIRCIKK